MKSANEDYCGKYQHFKNKNLYEVIGVARHSETLEEMIIYKALYECEEFGKDQIWVRPKIMFFEQVEYEGSIVPRFMKIS
ncbi:hypothetical protein BN59_03652 [Legionella massiliensis]|uniref:DUF1653 domain-containing protein n=1 Tax=Legionella massiliensis TaxID=1034943 RepID=A0A078L5G7_9GAMM|nr:DUF1653 domain-containing protein [Legionella massiliensis]CDZ77225.1 hypothetical protein BN59_01507 [Legionella massiliensis]CDZ79334.1 hypothetical protein BN59_03652 [Legionella massiliensis]CEE12963.1 hypothetical protein BN1094_01507 [Legionella massiliensis]CEE15072.1 hypothetical protein BN1094_03652 [Legionella massiliensis]